MEAELSSPFHLPFFCPSPPGFLLLPLQKRLHLCRVRGAAPLSMPCSAKFLAFLTAIPIGLPLCLLAVAAAAQNPPAEDSVFAAVCPIVYQLDESPSSRGYHYTFFGNAFFINEQGYLLTVAHVLDTFRDGGQPYILITRPNAPPRLMQANIVAVDHQHDVAILRANPNPFSTNHNLSYLPLSPDPASSGQAVIALSLHPRKLQNAQSFQIPVEDRSSGEVLSYESTQLDKSAPPAQVFLLSHSVNLGQSGSPVLGLASNAVVGLVEGRWLRASAASALKSDSTPGAAIPIQYAIDVLQRQSIAWHALQPLQPASNSVPSGGNPH
jgi:Trypsin-like peptidase domain